MSSVNGPGVNIMDGGGGEGATVTDGRLDVNATIGASVTVALDASGDSVECIQDTAGDLNATVDCNGSYVKLKANDGTVITDGSNSGMIDVTIHSSDGTAFSDNSGKMNVQVGNAIGSGVYSRITDGVEVANVTTNNELEVYIADIHGSAVLQTLNSRTANSTQGKVAIGSSTTEILDAQPLRFSVTIVNDSDEVIYLGFGEDAVLNEGVRLNPNGGSYWSDVFTDAIDGICASGSKNVTVLELHT